MKKLLALISIILALSLVNDSLAAAHKPLKEYIASQTQKINLENKEEELILEPVEGVAKSEAILVDSTETKKVSETESVPVGSQPGNFPENSIQDTLETSSLYMPSEPTQEAFFPFISGGDSSARVEETEMMESEKLIEEDLDVEPESSLIVEDYQTLASPLACKKNAFGRASNVGFTWQDIDDALKSAEPINAAIDGGVLDLQFYQPTTSLIGAFSHLGIIISVSRLTPKDKKITPTYYVTYQSQRDLSVFVYLTFVKDKNLVETLEYDNVQDRLIREYAQDDGTYLSSTSDFYKNFVVTLDKISAFKQAAQNDNLRQMNALVDQNGFLQQNGLPEPFDSLAEKYSPYVKTEEAEFNVESNGETLTLNVLLAEFLYYDSQLTTIKEKSEIEMSVFLFGLAIIGLALTVGSIVVAPIVGAGAVIVIVIELTLGVIGTVESGISVYDSYNIIVKAKTAIKILTPIKAYYIKNIYLYDPFVLKDYFLVDDFSYEVNFKNYIADGWQKTVIDDTASIVFDVLTIDVAKARAKSIAEKNLNDIGYLFYKFADIYINYRYNYIPYLNNALDMGNKYMFFTYPNNKKEAFLLRENLPFQRAFGDASDEDYFEIDLRKQKQTVSINIKTSSIFLRTLDTVATLYNYDTDTIVATADDNGSDKHFLLKCNLQPGRYYVKVQSKNSPVAGAEYYIQYDLSPIAKIEDNKTDDSPKTAPLLKPNSTLSAHINYSEDVDNYRISVSHRTQYSIKSTGSIPLVATLETVDSPGTKPRIDYFQNKMLSDSKNFEMKMVLEPGEYNLKIRAKNHMDTGEYSLLFNKLSSQDGADNFPEEAYALEKAISYPAMINEERDIDWYSFELPQKTTATLRLTDLSHKEYSMYVYRIGEAMTAEVYLHLQALNLPYNNSGAFLNLDNLVYQDKNALDEDNKYFYLEKIDFLETSNKTPLHIEEYLDKGKYFVAVESKSNLERIPDKSYTIAYDYEHKESLQDSLDKAREIFHAIPAANNLGNFKEFHYYKVVINDPSTCSFETLGNLATYGELLSSRGAPLQKSSFNNANFKIVKDLLPGEYYIKVFIPDTFKNSVLWRGQYQMLFRILSSQDTCGNTFNQAGILAPDIERFESINYTGDVDFYRLDIPYRTEATIESLGKSDTIAILFNADQRQMLVSGSDGRVGVPERNFKIKQVLEAGTYYVRVSEENNGRLADYSIRYTITSQDKTGNEMMTSKYLLENMEYKESIDYGGDIDFYSFGLNSSATIFLYYTSTFSSNTLLLDENGEEILSRLSSSTASSHYLPAGTYYISVAGTESQRGSYSLKYVQTGQTNSFLNSIPSYRELSLNSSFQFSVPEQLSYSWFKIKIPAQGEYKIETTKNYSTDIVDPSFYMYTALGSHVATGSKLPIGYYSQGTLKAGEYYIRVNHGSSTNVPGIRFGIQVRNLSHPDLLPNSFSRTPWLGSDVILQDSINYLGDKDYVKFRVPYKATVKVSIQGSENLNMGIYDSNQYAVISNSNIQLSVTPNWNREIVLEEGDYYIYISGSTVGEYLLSWSVLSQEDRVGNNLLDSQLLVANSSFNEKINYSGDKDFYKIVIPYKTEVKVRSYDGMGMSAVLFDETGKQLRYSGSSTSNPFFTIACTLDAGDYYLLVTSSNSLVMSEYSVRYQIGDTEDKAADTMTEGTMLTSGEGLDEAFDFEGDLDWYKIYIFYKADICFETAGELDTYGALYDNKGKSITWMTGGGVGKNFKLNATLEAGTYYLQVRKNSGSLGTYQVVYQVLSARDGVGNSTAGATSLKAEVEMSEGIQYKGDQDVYRLDIPFKTDVVIETFGHMDLVGIFYDGTGTVISSNIYSGGQDKNIKYQISVEPGVYYMQVRRNSGLEIGDYRIRYSINLTSDKVSDSFFMAQILTLDQEFSENIDYKGDMDYYKMEVPYKTEVVVESLGEMNLHGVLFDVEGKDITWSIGGGEGKIFKLTYTVEPGIYYIRVQRYNDKEIGAYRIKYTLNGIEDKVSNFISGCQLLALEEEIKEHIDYYDDVDFYKIEVPYKTDVVIESLGDLDLQSYLFTSTNAYVQRLTSGGEGKNFKNSITLEAGTYYLRVEIEKAPYTGLYGLKYSINKTEDKVSDAILAAQPLIRNQEFSENMDYRGDMDFYKVEVPYKTEVVVESLGEMNLTGTLFDAEGKSITWMNGGGEGKNFKLIYTVEPGVYYVRVQRYNENDKEMGAYRIKYTINATADGVKNTFSDSHKLIPGQEFAEHIDYRGDADYYKIELPYKTDMTLSLFGELSLDWVIYNASKQVISDGNYSQKNSKSISRTLDAGIYYITVREKNFYVLGAYGIKYSIYSTADKDQNTISSSLPIVVNQEYSEYMDYTGDVDYYKIEIPYKTELIVQTLGDLTTYANLYNSQGTLISRWGYAGGGEGKNVKFVYTAEASTYYISIGHSSGSGLIGNYRIRCDIYPTEDKVGNNLATSQSISMGEMFNEYINYRGDIDFYKLDVFNETNISIVFSGDLNLEWILYNEQNQVLTYGKWKAEYGDIKIPLSLKDRTYYLQVKESYATYTGAYGVKYTATPLP